MPNLYYHLLALLLTAFVVLSGFDLGAGVLHLFVAKDDRERRVVLAAIGPHWDGNEVWLLAAGGTMLLAFPSALGAALSGLYLAVFFIVWSLMLRGLSIELRNHLQDELWRAACDALLGVSSALLCVLLGAALGNVLRGFSFDEGGQFSLPLFASFMPRAPVGLLDVFTVSVGAFALLALGGHGASFLAWKTDGLVHDRSARLALWLGIATALVWPVLLVFALAVGHLPTPPVVCALIACAAIALGARVWLLRARSFRGAFLASCAFFGLAIFGTAVARAPWLLVDAGGERHVSADAAAASAHGLAIGLWWWPIAFVLAAVYGLNLFRIHRGKALIATDA